MAFISHGKTSSLIYISDNGIIAQGASPMINQLKQRILYTFENNLVHVWVVGAIYIIDHNCFASYKHQDGNIPNEP